MTITPTDLQAVIGIFLPVLVAVVKRENFPNYVNAAIAIVVYIVAGALSVLLQAQTFDLNNIVPAVAIFTASGTIAYQLWWKNWGDPQITAKVNGGTSA